jgi:hypothetical protein
MTLTLQVGVGLHAAPRRREWRVLAGAPRAQAAAVGGSCVRHPVRPTCGRRDAGRLRVSHALAHSLHVVSAGSIIASAPRRIVAPNRSASTGTCCFGMRCALGFRLAGLSHAMCIHFPLFADTAAELAAQGQGAFWRSSRSRRCRLQPSHAALLFAALGGGAHPRGSFPCSQGISMCKPINRRKKASPAIRSLLHTVCCGRLR